MKILVTGGTVFVSRYTAAYFVGKGHQVCVLNRNTRAQVPGVELIEADRHELGGALRGREFDAVLDITAYNGRDVDALLDGLDGFKTYILISSSAVYPESLPRPFREDMPLGENTLWGAYGTGKIEAEETLRRRVPGAYILRPPYLYGPMDNVYREAFVFDCAEQGRPFYLPGDGGMALQFFHVEDLCRFMEILLERGAEQKIYNVGNPGTVTVRQWAQLCYGVLEKVPEFVEVRGDVEQRSYFPFLNYDYTLDVSEQEKIMPALKDLRTGLEEAYRWYKENKEQVRVKPLLEFIDANLK